MSATSTVEFFKPQHIVGSLTDWELQTGGNPTIARQRAQSLQGDGDELNAVQFGVTVSYVENFTAKKVTNNPASGQTGHSDEFSVGANLAVPNVGAIMQGAHVDGITVTYNQQGFPGLAVNSHKHAAVNGTPSNHDLCRVYKCGVQLPARPIGIPSTLKDTDNNTIFTCPTGVGMKGLTYALAVTHQDEPDGDGGHLAGQNRDGIETLTLEFTGKVAIADLDIDAGWMLPESDADGQGNTIATTKSITITRHIKWDTDATPDGGDK